MAQSFHSTSGRASCSLTRQQFRAAKTHGAARSRRVQCAVQLADRDILMAGEQHPQLIGQISAVSDTDVDISKLLEDAMKAKSVAKAAKSVVAPPAPVPAPEEVVKPIVESTSIPPDPTPAAPVVESVSPLQVEPPVAPVPAEVVNTAVENVQPPAAEVQLPDVSSTLESTVGSAASNVAEGAQKLQESLDGGLTALTSGVDAGVGQAMSTVSEGAEKLQSALGSITGEANKTLGAAASTVTEGAEKLTGAVSSQLSALQGGVDSVSSQLNSTYSSALQQVESVYRPVAEQVDGTVAVVSRTVSEEYIPTAVKLAGVAGVYTQQAAPYAAVGGALALFAAYNSFKRRYSGFAGELSPEQVRELLLTDNALLVDIRSNEEREKAGLPELKLKARFRAVVWEPIEFVPTIKANQLNGVDELVKDVNAAYIGGLSQVSTPLTKFIIMDSQGTDKAREIARALKRVGYGLPFIMEGGFDSWVAAGLPTVPGTIYEASVVNLISDEIEVTVNRTVEVLQPLANPWLGLPVAAGAVLGAFAVANYHKTFEYIGVLSLLITVEKKLFSYESPADLWKDVAGAAGSAASFVGDKVSSTRAARGSTTRDFALATEAGASTAESASYVESSRDVESASSVAESESTPAESTSEAVPASVPEPSSPVEAAVQKSAETAPVPVAAAEVSNIIESESPVDEKKPVEAGAPSPKEPRSQSA